MIVGDMNMIDLARYTITTFKHRQDRLEVTTTDIKLLER